MTSSITLNETMSGWIENNKDGRSEVFSFTITVFFANRLRPLSPQPFKGKVRLDERDYEAVVEGELTLKPTGPRYDMDFMHPDLGLVRVAGEKTYSLSNLARSLVTCPLTVYQSGSVVGDAEVAYRESMLAFPFKALGFTTQTAAFLPYQAC